MKNDPHVSPDPQIHAQPPFSTSRHTIAPHPASPPSPPHARRPCCVLTDYIRRFCLTGVSIIAYIVSMEKSALKQLAAWESALKAELDALSKRRNEMDTELRRVAKKLELVRQMRSLEESASVEVIQDRPAAGATNGRATSTSVREAVKKILTDSGRPIHITQIHREFVEKGYPIPGRGTAFNILAHLVNDKEFVRVARGTYALAGSVPPEQVLQKAMRKRKRARRRKKRATEFSNREI
jgi:hypothetical protein